MITVALVCVRVGDPGEEDQYEMWFKDTETDEESPALLIEPDGTMRLSERD